MIKEILPEHPESFWHMTASVDQYPQLEENIEVDIAVVGGGMAGILSAYELSKAGKRVALLEARRMIYGTTGYTTSKLSAQHDIIYHDLIKRYGTEKARSYYAANMEGIEIIKAIAKEYQIECELQEQDAYAYTQLKERAEEIKNEAEAYKKLSIDGDFTTELPVGLDIEAAVVMHKQYEFHPVMFLAGVLRELEKMGVLIFENTMVAEIKDGEKVEVKTENGPSIRCKKAICASHYPVDDPDKFYTDNMDPSMSLATIYEYPEEYPGGMYISYDPHVRTFRLVTVEDKQYLLVGGEGHKLGTGTSELARYETIVDFAQKTFGVKEVIAYWSSHDYMTKDRLPLAGLNRKEKTNILVITGLNKWGLTNAAVCAKLLKDMIEGKENPYQELFDPHREIPELEGLEEDEPEEEETKKAVKKTEAADLKTGEALTYEKDDEKFGIFRDSDGELHHLNLTCTHLGCQLGWNDGDRTWDCPCHGSRFDAVGEVIEGPAMKPLKKADNQESK